MATQSAENSIPQASTEKKPYVRNITEKRREQNRRSQKVYREKLKKRLASLEDKVHEQESVLIPETAPCSMNTPMTPVSKERSYRSETSIEISASAEDDLQFTRRDLYANFIDLNDAFEAAGDLVLPAETNAQVFNITLRPGQQEEIFSGSTASSEDDTLQTPPPLIPMAPYYYIPPDLDSLDMRPMWPLPARLAYETYIPPPTAKSISFTNLMNTSSSSSSFYSMPITRAHSNPISNPLTSLPSPYLNHIQLSGEACFSATLAIAASLGISRSAYVNDHPSRFPETTLNQNLHLKPALRPTHEQLSLPHPCYLDCIIFPRFRSNAIILSSRSQLDHCSLFLDLMHDGLVCWGSRYADARHGRGMGDGVAWSKRSWEAKPWFWRKWGWLCFGLVEGNQVGRGTDQDLEDEDGLLEGSRWWWALKGEGIGMGEEAKDESEMLMEIGKTPAEYLTCNVGLRSDKDIYHWD